MKKILYGVLLTISYIIEIYGQGPPITADKPIMLGSNAVVIKTLSEYRSTDEYQYLRTPLMFHYLPSSNSLLAVHLPWVSASPEGDRGDLDSGLGDIGLLGKYQFYRKDGKGKTLRMVLKTYQLLPTGKSFPEPMISSGQYQGYYAIVVGRESIKYGLSGEIGYNWVPNGNFDEFRVKIGAGLPLLKPLYPVNQVNLYFEYAYNERPALDERELLYAQGIQYAKGRWTWEVAVQVPLYQQVQRNALNSNLLVGARFIF
ncbi:MAG: hypothetical protein AAFQ02_01390 [Bacteroidota bacterium]